MLQSIRDSLTGWVVWFIVGLIAIPFAFVGIESFRMGGRDPVLVKVGDTEITQSQFRAGYDQRYQQLQMMLGESFRADLFNTDAFRQSVLDDMVQEALLRQHAERAGFRASDAAVVDYVRSIPAFQRDGRFSTEAYRAVLARQGLTPDRFESQLRSALAIEQMRDAVLASGFVADPLVGALHRLERQQRSLAYVTVPVARFRDGVTVTDDDIAQRYEATRSQHQAPERLRVDYVLLDRRQLERAADPDEAMLAVLYDAEKARFTTPGERRARHILIPFNDSKSAAREKALALRAELESGADFAALAAEHSADPGSSEDGGDLGWIQRGQMVEGFEKALFALEQGQISAPVETEFGFHLIRVDEIKPEQTRTLEDPEVRETLLTLYHNREQDRRFQAKLEQMEQLAFERSGSLQPIAEALGLEIQRSDWFTRAGAGGLLAERNLLAAAFSPEVLQDDDNSQPIALADGRVVVLRKGEYEPARQKPLEEVAEALREGLIAERAQAAASALAEDLLTEARNAGKPLAELAEARNLTVRSTGPVGRDHAGVAPAILDRLFRLPRPVSAEQPVYDRVLLDNGDAVVLALSAVSEPEVNPVELVQPREQLENLLAGLEFNAYQAAARERIKVRVKRPLEPARASVLD